MKKLIFVFAFALLGTYFQSAQAQTFSRVVTVTKNLDQNECFQRRYQIDTLFLVPNGKIFKIELLQGSFQSAGSRLPVKIFINNVLITQYQSTSLSSFYRYAGQNVNSISSTSSSTIWLKNGDFISFEIDSYYDCQVFLSGIEYDAQ